MAESASGDVVKQRKTGKDRRTVGLLVEFAKVPAKDRQDFDTRLGVPFLGADGYLAASDDATKAHTAATSATATVAAGESPAS